MSDDPPVAPGLTEGLTALAGRAQSAGRPAPAAAVVAVAVARRRRRTRRRAAATVPAVAVAVAAVALGLTHLHTGGTAGMAGTAGSAAASRAAAAPNSGLSPGTSPGSGSASTGGAPAGAAEPSPPVPAFVRLEPGAAGSRLCRLVADPDTAAAGRAGRGFLRADPTGVTAVWIPGITDRRDCRSTETSLGRSGAAALLARVEAAPSSAGPVRGCPVRVTAGSVDLVFTYAAAKPAVVTVSPLSACATLRLPDGTRRSAATLVATLGVLHPPAWVGASAG